MLNLGENKYPQVVTVWKVDDKNSYASVDISSSRKDKKSGEYINSNWKFVRFVGNAYNEELMELEPKDRIVIKAGGISSEPYLDKDGNKVWPKYPQIVVFAWEMAPARDGSGSANTQNEVVEEEEDGPLPF